MRVLAVLIVLIIAGCQVNKNVQLTIEGRCLAWDDFQGKPSKHLYYDAYTKWSIYYQYDAPKTISGDTVAIDFKVWRVLNATESWVRKTTKADKTLLLEHEQGHYDIAGLCVEELEESLANAIYLRSNYGYVIDSIYSAVHHKYVQLEKRYDFDTNHLYNRANQAIWNKRFKDKLH